MDLFEAIGTQRAMRRLESEPVPSPQAGAQVSQPDSCLEPADFGHGRQEGRGGEPLAAGEGWEREEEPEKGSGQEKGEDGAQEAPSSRPGGRSSWGP